MSDVQVSQAAREAAAAYYYSAGGSPDIARDIRSGAKDGWFRVQAFARFEQDIIARLATRPAPVGEPVAYLYTRDDGSRDLVLDCNGEYARRLLELGATETPLYTRPALDVDGLVEKVARDVAELPDRTSPDDWPDAMLVTADELREIILAAIKDATDAVA